MSHSVILGSRLACSSPRLIAACHDLYQRLEPNHSPSDFDVKDHYLKSLVPSQDTSKLCMASLMYISALHLQYSIANCIFYFFWVFLVDPAGFEPAAPALQRQCSTRLSYGPWLESCNHV